MKRESDKSDKPRTAAPFLKWAGGKTQLLREILPALPAEIQTYYEPFVGGGAVFFSLAAERRFKRAVIGDRNPALTEVYSAVRDDVGALTAVLKEHAPHATDREYFYRTRAIDPAGLSPAERAARMLFLNKTCFNGLWRANSRGIFNVPFGRNRNPRVLDEDLLGAASAALRDVEIVTADFEKIVGPAGKLDAVYFDPPYHPLSKSSSFTAYDPFPFREGEHERLARVFREVVDRGAAALLSNSSCDFTRSLFQGLACREVLASRMINSKADGRGQIAELLVVGTPDVVSEKHRFSG
ncbi:MAG: DNA adenine methylase [Deltaproteobacteria bacterium]|nr:DNA adenine methylase [Deltaproteobacteria bacterium]